MLNVIHTTMNDETMMKQVQFETSMKNIAEVQQTVLIIHGRNKDLLYFVVFMVIKCKRHLYHIKENLQRRSEKLSEQWLILFVKVIE